MRRIIEPSLPTLALVGRVNVGKSTLFNRLIGESRALVSPVPGTTRTRNVGIGWWRGEQFRVIDTGGLTFDETLPFEKEVVRQMEIASAEADLVLLVGDVREGVLPQERALASHLRNAKLPTLLVANKSDSPRKAAGAYDLEWRRLGFGEPMPVSAVTGFGVGDMLDAARERIAADAKTDSRGYADTAQTPPAVPPLTKGESEGGSESADLPPEPIKVAIVGRPNVGKSTLFNAIVGEERVIVSPLPHTTREAHDTLIEVDGKSYLFIDTAGIRKKARVGAGLERLSVAQTFRTIDEADVALLLLDASESLGHQDKALARRIADKGKGCIIVVNKWDLFKKLPMTNHQLPITNNQSPTADRGAVVEQYVRDQLNFIDYAPVVRISALTGEKVPHLFSLIDRIAAARKKQISDEECEAFLRWVIVKKLPVRGRGVHHPKLLRMKQIAALSPTFEVAIKVKTSVANAYLDFLGRMLRERFDFFGTPVVVYAKKVKRI